MNFDFCCRTVQLCCCYRVFSIFEMLILELNFVVKANFNFWNPRVVYWFLVLVP